MSTTDDVTCPPFGLAGIVPGYVYLAAHLTESET